jgi:LuxR family maltose regulon positive regulatory protein
VFRYAVTGMPRKSAKLAKLTRPRLYDALPRERLFSLLDEHRKHPGIWIAAPPGAGKTTLLAGYVQSRDLSCLWYQIDPADSDPAAFFYYLGLAERDRAARGAAKKDLPLLAPEYLLDLTGFTRRYFRQLFARLARPIVMVFDNFQELLPESKVHDVLCVALEEAPEGTSMVFLSRLEPDQKYLRYAANSILSRVDWKQLKLTWREAESILRAQLHLDTGVARKLHELSGGWVAGLRLIGEWIHRGGPLEELGNPDSLQDVFGYFAGELFARASDASQQALLRLSFLPRIPASAAERMTGSASALKLLEDLYRAHLFVDRRQGVEPVYQLHALLRAFLLHRAGQLLDPGEMNAAAISAARLLEEFQYPEDAMPLYVSAGDVDSAVALVLKEAKQLIAQGRWRQVIDWTSSLPTQTVSDHCWLGYWLGSARIAVDPAFARETFEGAFDSAVEAGDESCQIETAAAIIQTYVLQYTHFRPLDRWIGILETRVNRIGAFRDAEAELRVLGAFLMALAYRQPGHTQLPRIVNRVFELVQSDVDVNLRLVSASYLCACGATAGPLQVSRRVIPVLLQLLDRSDIKPANAAWSWFAISWFHCISRNEREGRDAVARVDRIAEQEGLPYVRKFSAIIGAWIELYAGNLDVAQSLVNRLERLVNPAHPYDVAILHGARGFLYLLRGQPDLSYADSRKAVEYFDEAASSTHQMVYRINLVLPLLQKKMYAEALAVIADMHRMGSTGSMHWWVSAMLAMEAYIELQAGHREAGRLALAKAFELGRVQGEDYGFGNCLQQIMPTLCAEALYGDIEIEYTQNLIRRHGWRAPMPDPDNWPWPIKIYTLGKFRIELGGQLLVFPRKAPRKVLTLLKAIIAFGERGVPQQRLIAALWPDQAGEAPTEALNVGLHRLRKMLVYPGVVQLAERTISIDRGLCWVDAWALERRLAEKEAATAGKDKGQGALQLYGGTFLPDDLELPWAHSLRERLRGQFLRYVARIGKGHEEAGNLEAATLLYQKGIEADNLAEELYQGLMRCHIQQERRAEAMAVYRRLRQTLSVTLSVQPSPRSEQLFKTIQDC